MLWVKEDLKKKNKVLVHYPELNPNKLVFPEEVTLENIHQKLGRKYKSAINGLQPLLHFIKKNENNGIVSISQTAKPLVDAYKGQPNVKRAIDKLVDLGILRKTSNQFKNFNYGLIYTVNINTLNLIYNKSSYNISYSISYSEPEEYVDTNAHFGKIRKKDNMRDYSDTWVLRKMDEVYPQIKDYQYKVEKLNSHEEDDFYLIRFNPKVTRDKNGHVKNVSIRATSDFCSVKSREKHPEFPWYIKCREDYLDEDLGIGWEEYDVKGSVPRIAHFLHTGEWLDENVDPYKEIFESHFFDWDKDTRDICKDWFMRIYFGGTIKEIVRNAINCKDYPNLTSNKKEQLTKDITELKEAIDNYCGVADGNSIFLHESCIYIDVREELAKRKIDVKQVYDGFYFKHGEVPKDMGAIIKQCAISYLSTYSNYI